MIVYAILAIVLSSTSSTAQPVFLAGRYVLPITQHDLYVSAPGPLGTTVTVNFRFKPIGSCTNTLDSVFEYQLPPGYNDTPINEVKATCNKTIQCSGIEFKCVGARQPYPMSFQHVPQREIKASGGSFSGTYRYVSSSTARTREALAYQGENDLLERGLHEVVVVDLARAEDAVERAIDDADQAIVELTCHLRIAARYRFDERVVGERTVWHVNGSAGRGDDPQPGLSNRPVRVHRYS